MSSKKRILYAGDSPAGGSANYLLAILKAGNFQTVHIPPGQKLSASVLKRSIDAIIFSDYSRKEVPDKIQKIICRQVEDGTGFLMVGGWGSFSGPFGGWKGSRIEAILPVTCLARDDRKNFPSGAFITIHQSHPVLNAKSFENPPAIMGINEVRPKKKSITVLTAKRILKVGNHATLDPIEYPLLVIDSNPAKRIAAFTTDFAPHWCGGMVDWGKSSVKLPVNTKINVEVGNDYIDFVTRLLKWLAGA